MRPIESGYQKTLAQGRELFDREWQPGDLRSPAGDGLGPVYNDTSCVACHNLGGTGGRVDEQDVQIITATADNITPSQMPPVGCATCHIPKLGEVEGLYSDLLLHDLGPGLGDTGQYGTFDPSSSEDEIIDETGPIARTTDDDPLAPTGESPTISVCGKCRRGRMARAVHPRLRGNRTERPLRLPSEAPPQVANPKQCASRRSSLRPRSGPASRFEWRTPPLWGFRDSGPYLHDGRAATLDQAVGLHDGEVRTITMKYFELSTSDAGRWRCFSRR